MDFKYSSSGLVGRDKLLQRFFEIVPGATSLFILIGMVALSFFKPFAAAVVIIAFDLYWLMRLFYATLFLVLSFAMLRANRETDWMAQVRAIDSRDETKILNKNRRRQIHQLFLDHTPIPKLSNIHHLVIIPVANESREVIEPDIVGLVEQDFPKEKMLVILAVEARAKAAIREDAYKLVEKYKHYFLDFLVVLHPDNIPGEARVKGANATFAAQAAAVYFEKKNIHFDDVIVSCLDADTVVTPQYFSCLTYHFMACPNRIRASFQPIPVYHNNIWEAPGFARVLEMGSSFFLLIEATNTEKLVTFSSHSMSFRALVDVGYWPVDMISDDSAIFWKAFIDFDGDYQVVPIYVTVSMDVTMAKTSWKTALNIYRQRRRWAWGVENFPLVMRAFIQKSSIPVWDRARHAFKLLESHVAWATWAFLLTFIGWLPAFYSSKQFSNSVLYYSSPRITGIIFNLSLFSFIISIGLSLLLLPKKKTTRPLLKRLGFALEWLQVPLVVTFLSALPALDAQMRLMLGKYLTFHVTDKHRK